MSKRKTIEISKLVEMTNSILKNSGPECVGIRQGVSNVLESVLMDTKNYKGFRYLDQTEVDTQSRPGIRSRDNDENMSYQERFTDTDDTRRYYFYHK